MRIISFALLVLVLLIPFVNYRNQPEKSAADPANANASPVNRTIAPVGSLASSIGVGASATTPAVAPVGIVTGENACVERADGATVCGAIVPSHAKAASSPFDQAAVSPFDRATVEQLFSPLTLTTKPEPERRPAAHDAERTTRDSKSSSRPPPFGAPKGQPPRRTEDERQPTVSASVAQLRTAHEAKRNVRTSRHSYRARLSGKAERYPQRRDSVDATPWLSSRRDRWSPPSAGRGPPARNSAAGRKLTAARYRPDRERTAHNFNENHRFLLRPHIHSVGAVQLADLERRTDELERELRAIRTERARTMSHNEHSHVVGRSYSKQWPAVAPTRDVRRVMEPRMIGPLITHSALSLRDGRSNRDQPHHFADDNYMKRGIRRE